MGFSYSIQDSIYIISCSSQLFMISRCLAKFFSRKADAGGQLKNSDIYAMSNKDLIELQVKRVSIEDMQICNLA